MEEKKEIIVTVSPGVLLIALAIIVAGSFLTYKAISGNSQTPQTVTDQISDVVTTKDGKQYITVLVQGSYSPRAVTAKGGIPTVLVMKTDNSYGCERSFRIAKLGVSQVLPENGETPIDLGTPTSGTKIYGTCSMGMYSISINFN